jgi:penicillin-binding protein 2
VPSETFDIIHDAMQDVVEHGTGQVAKLPGVEVCAKTGTVENKAVINGEAMKMKDHSVFVAFAPKKDPKIVIAVIVENAGFGASWAGPIASLMMEKYLKGKVDSTRKSLEKKMFDANLINNYTYLNDSAQRKRDRAREQMRTENRRYDDSLQRATDSVAVMRWLNKTYLKK